VKVLDDTPTILDGYGRLCAHLFQQPLLYIQAGQFGFKSFLSTQDLCAFHLDLIHIDCFGQRSSLPSGNIFTTLYHLLLIGTPLTLQCTLFGRRSRLLQIADGQALLALQHGAVAITDALITLGRTAFYRETFGNEVFLSEIMGIVDGPLTPWRTAKALWALGGRGTTNLQIPLDVDVTIGGTTFPS
jgi:hypothetical protein